MKSQMAACRLAGRAAGRAVRQIRPRHASSRRSTQIFDETEQKCRNVVAQLPDGVYEAEASHRRRRRDKGEPVPIHVKVTIKGSEMTIDLSGCSAERKAGDQLAHATPARASPTRR